MIQALILPFDGTEAVRSHVQMHGTCLIAQWLGHVGPILHVSQLAVVVARAHARDNSKLVGSMFLPCNPLSLLHEQRTEPLVLELARVASGDRNSSAVYVELAHNGSAVVQFSAVSGGAAQRRSYAQIQRSPSAGFARIKNLITQCWCMNKCCCRRSA